MAESINPYGMELKKNNRGTDKKMNKYKDRVSLVEEYLDRVSLNKDIESFYKDKLF